MNLNASSIDTVDKSERESDGLERSAGCEQQAEVGEFVNEIQLLLTSMADMCACLHAPYPEPWSGAQHRALKIVERALRDALGAIDRCGQEFNDRSSK